MSDDTEMIPEIPEESVATAAEETSPERVQRERAPRENFNSMTDEQLEEILKEHFQKSPNHPEEWYEQRLAEIENKITKINVNIERNQARFDSLRAGFDEIKKGNQLVNDQRKELLDLKDKLTGERDELMERLRRKKDDVKEAFDQKKESANKRSAESIEEEIREKEEEIETSTLTVKQEQTIERAIKELKKQLLTAKRTGSTKQSIDQMIKEREQLQKDVDAKWAELKEVYEKLDAIKASSDKEKNDTSRQEKFDKLKAERDDLFNARRAQYEERKQLRDEQFADKRIVNEAVFRSRRQRAARAILHRRQEEREEAELRKKEEEEELKRHPFEKEMNLCDTVVAYLTSFIGEPAAVAKKVSDQKAPRAAEINPELTKVEKEEEDMFGGAVEHKKAHKKKPKSKATKKEALGLKHSMDALEYFSKLHMDFPNTKEEAKAGILIAKKRKEFFQNLPRGANVDEEFKKLSAPQDA